jgi:hypothetical protein
LNLLIAFFQAGLVLLVSGVGALAWVGAAGAIEDIPTGWATLVGPIVGAVIGGLAIGWQARAGFKTLKLSQEGQAEIARDLEAEKRRMDAITLSSALRGELLAVSQIIKRTRYSVYFVKKIAEKAKSDGREQTITPQLPTIECPIYLANASQIGLLGPDMAVDVALLFTDLLSLGKSNVPLEASPTFSMNVAEGYRKSLEYTYHDINHTSKRLDEFAHDGLISASLYSIRIAREGAKH